MAIALPPTEAASELERLFARQRAHHPAVRATSAAARVAKLRALEKALLARRAEAQAALAADFQKPAQEVDLTELVPVISELRFAARHLGRWMRPARVSTPALKLPGYSSRVLQEPKGVVAILAPWNYPVNLTLGPLVGAVAAGNCVLLKPSELTPHTSRFLKELLGELFPVEEVAVVEGDAAVAQALLRLPLDHIYFTGSPQVGKLVMKAAAEHLTSVTLELGGKSPAIVDASADVEATAAKLAFGKFPNTGQTCIAPDYVLVHERVRGPLLEALGRAVRAFYGPEEGWARNPDFPRIVNERHAQRLQGLLDSARAAGARVTLGGQVDVAQRYVAPTVVTDVPLDVPLMQEEIFGPILPVLPVASLDEAVAFVNARPKPLALYVFSEDTRAVDQVLSQTSAGGGCVNDTLLHYLNPALPFGGIGNSGIGRGHGHAAFLAFSNPRAVLTRKVALPVIPALYPPYGRSLARRLVDALLRYL